VAVKSLMNRNQESESVISGDARLVRDNQRIFFEFLLYLYIIFIIFRALFINVMALYSDRKQYILNIYLKVNSPISK